MGTYLQSTLPIGHTVPSVTRVAFGNIFLPIFELLSMISFFDEFRVTKCFQYAEDASNFLCSTKMCSYS